MSGKWDTRFLTLAEHVAQWSKDPSTKTGAVIVDSNNRIISIGYNGFPRGVKDLPERLENRETKYKIIVHAEQNAVLFANGPLVGCRIYIWPFLPCARCAAIVIQAGISEVVAPPSDNPRWNDDFDLASILFSEAGVKVRIIEKTAVI